MWLRLQALTVMVVGIQVAEGSWRACVADGVPQEVDDAIEGRAKHQQHFLPNVLGKAGSLGRNWRPLAPSRPWDSTHAGCKGGG